MKRQKVVSVNPSRLQPIRDYCDGQSEVFEFIRQVEGCFIGGGCLRSYVDATDKINDIDLFFIDENVAQQIDTYLVNLENCREIFRCPKGELVSFKLSLGGAKIQLIKKYYATPTEFLKNFDINACRFMLNGDKLHIGQGAITDVKKRLIRVNACDYPVATIKRMVKYGSYGYNLRGGDSLDIYKMIRDLPEGTSEEFYVD